jgi:hypothetical protein
MRFPRRVPSAQPADPPSPPEPYTPCARRPQICVMEAPRMALPRLARQHRWPILAAGVAPTDPSGRPWYADALAALRCGSRAGRHPRNGRASTAAAFVVPRRLRQRDRVARLRSVPCRGHAKPGPTSHGPAPSSASFGGSTPSRVSRTKSTTKDRDGLRPSSMVLAFWPTTVLAHRMVRPAALDHVRADLAWHHRKTARTVTALPVARPEAARNHEGRRRDGSSITGVTTRTRTWTAR